MARLAAMLGSPTRNGKGTLADCLARAGRPTVHWTTTARSIRRSNRTPLWMAAAVCCLAAVVAVFWPGSHRQRAGAVHRQAVPAKPQAARANRNRRSGVIRPTDRPASRIDENAVVPATFQQPLAASARSRARRRQTFGGGVARPACRPARSRSIRVIGQCCSCPKPDLIVDKENVRFENIDFVWDHACSTQPRQERKAGDRAAAGRPCGVPRLLVPLRGGRGRRWANESRDAAATLHSPPTSVPVPAIRWVHPAQSTPSETSLPSGRIRLADCLFDRVGAGLDCHTVGALGHRVDQHAAPRRRTVGAARSFSAVRRAVVARPVASHAARRRIALGMPRRRTTEEQPGEISSARRRRASLRRDGRAAGALRRHIAPAAVARPALDAVKARW